MNIWQYNSSMNCKSGVQLFRRRFVNMTEDRSSIYTMRERLYIADATHLEFGEKRGEGLFSDVYEACYYATNIQKRLDFIAKLMNDVNLSHPDNVEMKYEHLNREFPTHLPYQQNILPIYCIKDPRFERIPGIRDYRFNEGIVLMKNCETTLQDWINHRVEVKMLLKYTEIIDLSRCLIDAVYHLYDNYLVHRDIHEGNVLLSLTKGRCYLGDFGSSLDLRNNLKHNQKFCTYEKNPYLVDHNYEGLTKFNNFFGSGYYGNDFSPPEVLNPDKNHPINYSKCDIYQLGRVINMLLVAHDGKKSTNSLLERVKILVQGITRRNFSERIGAKEAYEEIRRISESTSVTLNIPFTVANEEDPFKTTYFPNNDDDDDNDDFPSKDGDEDDDLRRERRGWDIEIRSPYAGFERVGGFDSPTTFPEIDESQIDESLASLLDLRLLLLSKPISCRACHEKTVLTGKGYEDHLIYHKCQGKSRSYHYNGECLSELKILHQHRGGGGKSSFHEVDRSFFKETGNCSCDSFKKVTDVQKVSFKLGRENWKIITRE